MASETTEETKTIEMNYKGATLGRIFSTHLFDFFTFVVLTLILLVPGMNLMQVTPVYQNTNSQRNEILVSSHLYIQEKQDAVLLSRALRDDDNQSYEEKSITLSSALSYFFDDYLKENSSLNDTSKIYTDYLMKYQIDGKNMFDEDRTRLLLSSDYDQNYFQAYYEINDAYAIGYFTYVNNYLSLRRTFIWCYVITILICLSLAMALIYLLVPLIFSKGKKTFGMKINHLGYVSYNGFSPSWKRYLLHFLFRWILVYLASLFTFGIPLFISVGMMFLGKHHQTLTDYVLGCFLVNAEEDLIFKDYQDYLDHQAMQKEADEHPLSKDLVRK